MQRLDILIHDFSIVSFQSWNKMQRIFHFWLMKMLNSPFSCPVSEKTPPIPLRSANPETTNIVCFQPWRKNPTQTFTIDLFALFKNYSIQSGSRRFVKDCEHFIWVASGISPPFVRDPSLYSSHTNGRGISDLVFTWALRKSGWVC